MSPAVEQLLAGLGGIIVGCLLVSLVFLWMGRRR